MRSQRFLLSACTSPGNQDMKARKRVRGLTLVELLIAVALGGILAGLLSNVVQGIRVGWTRTQETARKIDTRQGGVQFLFSSLSSAIVPDPRHQSTWFHGSKSRIEYMSDPPEAEKGRGRVNVKLYVNQVENGRRALIAEMNFVDRHSAIGDASDERKIAVLKDVESVAFSFTGMRNEDTFDSARWEKPHALPRLVRIEIRFSEDRTDPMQLMIAPRRNVSGSCNFDLVSLACRT